MEDVGRDVLGLGAVADAAGHVRIDAIDVLLVEHREAPGIALGGLDDAVFGRTTEALARGGVAIMTAAPGPVPMPPVEALTAAGVMVFAGSDNIRDAWSPLGNGDPLDRARLVAWRQGFGTDGQLSLALSLVTGNAARVLGLERYGLAEGAPGAVLALDAAHEPQAVAECPPRRVFQAAA